jgi:hypothetical protein
MGTKGKAYRVNETLSGADLRYCYALLCEVDDPRAERLRKEMGRAVDRLNKDESATFPPPGCLCPFADTPRAHCPLHGAGK